MQTATGFYYDVTDWKEGNPREGIGQVINSIIQDIKRRQTDSDTTTGYGKPGATIHIPSGDWRLTTQVLWIGNVVLDTATEAQADLDRTVNAFRPIPAIGA